MGKTVRGKTMSEPVLLSAVEKFMTAMVESRMTLDEIERSVRWCVIRRTLELHQFNQCYAAKALGIHRNTLGRHLREMKAAGLKISRVHRKNVTRSSGVPIANVATKVSA
jgi:DNA-binding NtrC family response regulator